MHRGISRRRVLGTLALGSTAAVALAACGETQIVTVEKIVTKEVPVERIVTKEVPVEKVVERIVTKEVVVEKLVEAAPQAQTVVFEHISDHTSGPRAKAMQWALERYAQIKPNVTVIFTPNSGNIGDTIPVRIAAGTMSESALLDGSFIFNFGPDGVFQPINDLLAKSDDFEASNYVFLTDQFSADLDVEFPYRDEWELGAPVYGLPYQEVSGGMAWNMDIFEAAGIDEPQDTWSYGAEFLEAARQLTNAESGEWGTLTTGGNDIHIWFPMAWGMGAKQLINADATKTTLFEDGGDKGLQQAVDLVLSDQVAPPVADARELAGEFGNLFQAGKVGMWPRRSDGTGFMVASIRDRFRWSLGPQPVGDVTGRPAGHRQNQPHLVTDAAFKRGNVESVVDFQIFMAGPLVQGRVAIDRGFAPVFWDIFKNPDSVAPPPLGMEWLETHLRNNDAHRWPKYHPSFREWLDFRGFVHKAFTGDQTVAEAVADATDFADDVLDRGREDVQRVFDFWGGANP